jgi:hypothetical protein
MASKVGRRQGSNMLIYKTLSAVAAAALGAALVLALPGFSPEVEARTPAPVVIETQPAATAPDCSQQAWPYYDANCLTRANGQPRTVRVVTTDRIVR